MGVQYSLEFTTQEERVRYLLDDANEIDDTEVEITQVEIPPSHPTSK